MALADAQLQGTSRVKAYLLPVGGALVGGLVGGAVGGPIGAIAGFKVLITVYYKHQQNC